LQLDGGPHSAFAQALASPLRVHPSSPCPVSLGLSVLAGLVRLGSIAPRQRFFALRHLRSHASTPAAVGSVSALSSFLLFLPAPLYFSPTFPIDRLQSPCYDCISSGRAVTAPANAYLSSSAHFAFESFLLFIGQSLAPHLSNARPIFAKSAAPSPIAPGLDRQRRPLPAGALTYA